MTSRRLSALASEPPTSDDGPHRPAIATADAVKPTSSFPTLALQFLLLVLFVRVFHLEERRGLFPLMLLAGIGALVHRQLPARWRPWFFLTVSLASFPLAFAWPHVADAGWQAALTAGAQQTAWLGAIGLILFGICHLPLSFRVRVALLISIGAGLFYWRSDATDPFWAVLGSMFMFRLWIYVRERRREKAVVPWAERLSYFFLLPNAFFPFFPIIDYRRFRNCRVSDDDGSVAQRGIAWILRGFIHLLLYRAVKIYLLPTPIDLIDIEYVALFLVTNYALYLQISGHFHIITGLLHLYGYDLPRTHDRYFLASSFSDIWRRINIYWKDLLTEHVFYPVFFTLRRLPRSAAIVAAVGVTFLATWLLHSWQAFWLLGTFPLATRDAALWIFAGGLVAMSSLWQYRAALAGVRPQQEVTPATALILSLKVAGTFAAVSFFWACWTVPKFPQLLVAVGMSGGITPRGAAVVAGAIVTVVTGGTLLQLAFARLQRSNYEPSLPLERSAFACVATMGVLVVVGMPQANRYFGYEVSKEIARLQSNTRTAGEAGAEMDAYYEGLAQVNLQSDPLRGDLGGGQTRHELVWTKATRERSDILDRELVPGWSGELQGVPFHVNRWGMHDHDYSRRKSAGVNRIAVAGSSATMGLGVPAHANFPSQVERRVNALIPQDASVEFMNFASGGYSAFQWSVVLREKVYPFDPNVVCYVAHQGELRGPTRNLARCYVLGYPRPFPCLEEILRNAGIRKGMSWGAIETRVEPYARQTLACLYRGIVANCRERNIRPVWVYLPLPGVEGVPDSMGDILAEMAGEAGFEVIDLSGWDDGYAPRKLVVDGHYHPSVLGHQLIADALLDALRERPGILPPLPEAP